MIRSFLPDLVTAISDCVQPVSDQCLAKGLIPDSVYKRVLESGGTSEDKARTLILAVKTSTETDSRCLDILISILEQVLPHGMKDAVLSRMRERIEKADDSTCMSGVVALRQQKFQLAPITPTSGELVKQQTSLFGKLEDSIRQHAQSCAEKRILEESMKTKVEENEKLKNELDSLKQNQTTDTAVNAQLITNAESRISACEAEMCKLRGKIEELESTIEMQGMRVKRGRHEMDMEMVNLMGQLSWLAHAKITEVQQEGETALREKEKEHLVAQAEGLEKLKEGEKKQAELLAALQEKEKELLAAQNKGKEKESLINKVELEGEKKEVQLLTALQEKEKELLAAQKEGKDKELKALTEKAAELQRAATAKDKLHRQEIEHLKTLSEKDKELHERDLKIKELEKKLAEQLQDVEAAAGDVKKHTKSAVPSGHMQGPESVALKEKKKTGNFRSSSKKIKKFYV